MGMIKRFVFFTILLSCALCKANLFKRCEEFDAVHGDGYLLSVEHGKYLGVVVAVNATYICPVGNYFMTDDRYRLMFGFLLQRTVTCDASGKPDYKSSVGGLDEKEKWKCRNVWTQSNSTIWIHGVNGVPELVGSELYDYAGMYHGAWEPWMLKDLGQNVYVDSVDIYPESVTYSVPVEVVVLRRWSAVAEPDPKTGVKCASFLKDKYWGHGNYRCEFGAAFGRYVVFWLRERATNLAEVKKFEVYGKMPCDQCDANTNICLCMFGLCSDRAGEICTCTMGFTGRNCDINIDECISDPCQEGSTCVDNVNYYYCECLPGYTGVNCDTQTDKCESRPCVNGGSCRNWGDRYTCRCPPNFAGRNCEDDKDECESNPCTNPNTNCINLIERYNCTCLSGYTGAECELDIDECTSNPCRNATCKNEINAYVCECSDGYTGHDCAEDIDECLSVPCEHGDCVDKPNGYVCTCKGYTGLTCETDLDPCISNPCALGAECINGINGYLCTCQPGFSGVLCDSDLDECASSPCKNNYTYCENLQNFYVCRCSFGFDEIGECLVQNITSSLHSKSLIGLYVGLPISLSAVALIVGVVLLKRKQWKQHQNLKTELYMDDDFGELDTNEIDELDNIETQFAEVNAVHTSKSHAIDEQPLC